MPCEETPPHEENPNMRMYRSYVSSGTSGMSVSDLAPRRPYLRRLVRRTFPADRQAAIVDLGCGDGALLAVAREAGYQRITGVDLSAEQIEIARARGLLAIHESDVLGFLAAQLSDSVDVMIAFDVLEHFSKKDVLSAVSEVHRVLKPGGCWIVHVPNGQSPFFGRIRYGDFTHEMAFTQKSLAAVLRVGQFSQIAFFEDAPVPHGLISFIRYVLWKILRNAWRLCLMIESGERGGDLILSQNFLAVAVKNNERS